MVVYHLVWQRIDILRRRPPPLRLTDQRPALLRIRQPQMSRASHICACPRSQSARRRAL
jgi:hypothetical protein